MQEKIWHALYKHCAYVCNQVMHVQPLCEHGLHASRQTKQWALPRLALKKMKAGNLQMVCQHSCALSTEGASNETNLHSSSYWSDWRWVQGHAGSSQQGPLASSTTTHLNEFVALNGRKRKSFSIFFGKPSMSSFVKLVRVTLLHGLTITQI